MTSNAGRMVFFMPLPPPVCIESRHPSPLVKPFREVAAEPSVDSLEVAAEAPHRSVVPVSGPLELRVERPVLSISLGHDRLEFPLPQ